MENLPAAQRALVQEFSWLPDEIAGGMVVPRHGQDIQIPFENTFASMGELARIPTELMHMIFEDLTFADLASLRRTCRLTRAMVPGCLSYRQLIWYLPSMLRAMSDMGLLGRHTIRHMKDTISSHNCVGCGNFGVCIFLVDFSRVCYTCLMYNEAFWVMPQDDARQCFNLGPESDQLIPYFWSIPKRYEMANEPAVYNDVSKKMVSVRAAKALAIKELGDIGLHNHLSRLLIFQVYDMETILRFEQLHHTPLQIGPEHHPPLRNSFYQSDLNGWPGMGSMLVPIVIKPQYSNVIVETGVWCRGCARASDEWHEFANEQKRLVWEQSRAEQRVYKTKDNIAMMMQSMEWASELFLNHAHNCYGLSLWKQEHHFPDLAHTVDFEELLDKLRESDDFDFNMNMDLD